MKGADLLKFILALIVVWIHAGDSDLCGIVNWAVPIFFVLSGFFLWGKILKEDVADSKAAVIVQWLRKTARLYLLWTFLYLPFTIYGFALEGMPFIKAVFIWIRNVLLVGENYLSWPLWYLLGMLWAGVIIWIAVKAKIPFWLLCVIAAIFYALPSFVSFEDFKWYAISFVKVRNGIFQGFPFMMLGGLIRFCLPSITGWSKESRLYQPSLLLRLFSIHIYLTHMIWVGIARLLFHVDRGVILWGIAVVCTVFTGILISCFPAVQRFLYGRAYVQQI